MWRTELNVDPAKHKITHQDPILTIGSCFADVTGAQLTANKFKVMANPFGTTYNPVSICKLLNHSIEASPPSLTGYVQRDELYLHHDFHSSFVATSKAELQSLLEEQIKHAHAFLKQAKFIIITFGTAYVYEQISSNSIVNNCHKVPAKSFDRKLLTVEQLKQQFHQLLDRLLTFNPDLQIICTVSPVRHVRDTLQQNSLSKSILRVFCDELQRDDANVNYFPAYELLIDDLRDYRFYKTDLIHPTTDAEDYIWEKFSNAYFDEKTAQLNNDWREVLKSMHHRPFNPKSVRHQQFLKKLMAKVESFSGYFNVDEELGFLRKQII